MDLLPPYVTKKLLSELGVRSSLARKYARALNETCAFYEITTDDRLAHFLSQVLHETGMLRYMEEIASGEQYEGRSDLGNVERGDGRRFKGRGAIQLTGRYNYTQYSVYKGVDFLTHPELVAQIPYCCDVAGWYWYRRGINELADLDDARLVTRAINGGLNGLASRMTLLSTARSAISRHAMKRHDSILHRMKRMAAKSVEFLKYTPPSPPPT